MGGHAALAQKTDDAYASDEGVRTDFLAPGRLDGKPEPALYPERADLKADAQAEREARVSSLLHAAAHTSKTGWQILVAAGTAVSEKEIELARGACVATTEHLWRVLEDLGHAKNALEPFSDAYASVVLLLDAMAQLPTPIAEADELRDLIPRMKVPNGFHRPTTIARAQKVAAAHVGDEADRATVVVHQLQRVRQVFDDAIQAYREDPDATPAAKAAAFGDAASFAAKTARYAETTLCDTNLGLDAASADHEEAIHDFIERAQRFVYWAMRGDAVEEPCNELAKAVAPLAARAGLPEIVVAAPRSEGQGESLDRVAEKLRGGWTSFFDAQKAALEDLAERPEPEDAPSWDKALVTGLCSVLFAGLGGGLGVLAQAIGETAFIQGIVQNSTEMLVESFGAAITSQVAASSKTPRRDFFMAQAYATIDTAKHVQEEVVTLAIDEALRSPQGGVTLQALVRQLSATAVATAATTKQRAVQAWATYLVTNAWGRDDASEGADMTGLGQGIGKLNPGEVGTPKNPNLEFKSAMRPAGVLELHVSLDGGPHVVDAIIHGLRSDDAKELTGAPVASLSLPVQIYVHGGYAREPLGDIEMTTPTYAVISRNDTGVFWLRDSNRVGRIELASLAGGDDRSDEDVLKGAAALWAALAIDRLPEVGS